MNCSSIGFDSYEEGIAEWELSLTNDEVAKVVDDDDGSVKIGWKTVVTEIVTHDETFMMIVHS